MASPVTVTPNDAWALLLWTMRYAMSRSSYAPSEAIALVLSYADALTTRQLEQIAEEIEEHVTTEVLKDDLYRQPRDIIRDLRDGAAKMREVARARSAR